MEKATQKGKEGPPFMHSVSLSCWGTRCTLDPRHPAGTWRGVLISIVTAATESLARGVILQWVAYPQGSVRVRQVQLSLCGPWTAFPLHPATPSELGDPYLPALSASGTLPQHLSSLRTTQHSHLPCARLMFSCC